MNQGSQGASSNSDALERLLRGAEQVVGLDELRAKLAQRPLRIKFGVDPTGADLTLGHAVLFRRLREFQTQGHQVVLIIGDFTAQIGDPTGRNVTRPQLDRATVEANAARYLEQASKFLDMNQVEVHHNSEWLSAFSFADALRLAGQATVADLLARHDFAARYKGNQSIFLHEFFYPLMQGYDSVAVRADVEMGGSDQLFNLLMGRQLQGHHGQNPQTCILMPLLVGLDGKQKMSKSLGNYIGVLDTPDEMFGKVMSIPDSLLASYLTLLTHTSEREIQQMLSAMAAGNLNPRDVKMHLAESLVTTFHDAAAAQAATEHFVALFQRHEAPQEMSECRVAAQPIEIARLLKLTGLADSVSAGRRLVEQGAVRLDNQRIVDATLVIAPKTGAVLQAGKRRFVRLVT